MPAPIKPAYRRDLKHLAVWPRRLGELLLVAAAVVGIALPWNGIYAIGEYSPQFVGLMLGALGTMLILFTLLLRARYRRHHGKIVAERR